MLISLMGQNSYRYASSTNSGLMPSQVLNTLYKHSRRKPGAQEANAHCNNENLSPKDHSRFTLCHQRPWTRWRHPSLEDIHSALIVSTSMRLVLCSNMNSGICNRSRRSSAVLRQRSKGTQMYKASSIAQTFQSVSFSTFITNSISQYTNTHSINQYSYHILYKSSDNSQHTSCYP
jgi:hypothetical protein